MIIAIREKDGTFGEVELDVGSFEVPRSLDGLPVEHAYAWVEGYNILERTTNKRTGEVHHMILEINPAMRTDIDITEVPPHGIDILNVFACTVRDS